MSVRTILNENNQISLRYLPPEALSVPGVQNPLTSTLQAFNPTQLVKHSITGADVVECATLQTETMVLVPGSLQTAIRSDESIELATSKRLVYQAAGEIAVGAGQTMTIGGLPVMPDVPAGSKPDVLGYDSATGEIVFQAAGGGGVTNPLSANLDCAAFDLDAVGAVNFNAAGSVTVPLGQSLTLGGTLVAPDVAAAGAPLANVLAYDPLTGDIQYQAAGGGGGVANPLTADLGCAGFNLNDVGQLNFLGAGAVSAGPSNDMNITGGVGASVVLDAGSVGNLTMNAAVPSVSLRPDIAIGFCELTMNTNAAELISGDKNCKLIVNGNPGAVSASLRSSAGKGFSCDETSGIVNMQANFGATAISLNGDSGGFASMTANSNAAISLSPAAGGNCTITAGGELALVGAGLQSATSSGPSGQFLRILLGGIPYKIALDLD